MSTDQPVTEKQVQHVRTVAWGYSLVSLVTLMIGIGGFGTASSGEVDIFGMTMQAKYACFIYFVLGALCLWSGLEAKKRGLKR